VTSQTEQVDDTSTSCRHWSTELSLSRDADVKLFTDDTVGLYAADAVVPSTDLQQEAACRVVQYLSQLNFDQLNLSIVETTVVIN